jgi:precorrin-8X/cobalt-precorrin-8 methylmutase
MTGGLTMIAYLRDPAEIYRRSFETVRREADLSRFSADEAEVAVRLVHAAGMPELAADLAFAPGAVAAGVAALRCGAPVLCDCAMVAAGITRRHLPAGVEVVATIGDPRLPGLAAAEATTRSAAQVTLWRPMLAGAVVAIGNAPTALFRLLEEIAGGAPRPAVVLGFPVGFVGAAESKAALAGFSPPLPHLTLPGRRGGSALAAAAVNALALLAAAS